MANFQSVPQAASRKQAPFFPPSRPHMDAPPPPPPSVAEPAPPHVHDNNNDEDDQDEEEDEDYPALPGQVWMEGDSLAPPCQSDMEIVPEIISLATIKASDVFYDLGCGDGRVCIAVAKATGARAKGVEIETNLLERFRTRLARAEAAGAAAAAAEAEAGGGRVEPAVEVGTKEVNEKHELDQQQQQQQQQQEQQQQSIPALRKGQVEVVGQDLLTVDLEEASVIYLYLLPEGIQALRPRIEAWLEEGAREKEEKEGRKEEEEGESTDNVSSSLGSMTINGEGRKRKSVVRRLVCNMWGLPGRTPTAKRDVGHMANVRLLLYESSSWKEEKREGEGNEDENK